MENDPAMSARVGEMQIIFLWSSFSGNNLKRAIVVLGFET
jgi:hypothetical protein